MDEGLSDYFACTVNNDSIFAASVLYYPHEPRSLENDWHPDFLAHDHYWNGQVIGGACWDLRQYIGVSLTDELVFDALYMADAHDFEDFALNVLVADDNDGLLYNGTPHYDDIEQAFETNHGIPVTLPPPPPPPLPPTGLEIVNLGQSGVRPQLEWNTVSGADSYTIYRWFTLYPVWRSVGGTTYCNFTDNSSTLYPTGYLLKYYVKAYNEGGYSGPSNIVSAQGYPSGSKRISEKAPIAIPDVYALDHNHPNPFNPATTIRYDLPEASSVSLTIYDMMGREVRSWRLHEAAGYQQVVWDGKNQSGRLAPAGIYIYRFTATSVESDKRFRGSRKMVLLK